VDPYGISQRDDDGGQVCTIPVLDRGGAVCNVRNPTYSGGAFGDGVHDDTEAIRSAIEHAGVGGTVLFPATRPGESYLVSNRLEIKDGQQWIGGYGDGKDLQRATLSNRSGVGPMIVAEGVNLDQATTGCRISGLSLFADPALSVVIAMSSAIDWLLDHVRVVTTGSQFGAIAVRMSNGIPSARCQFRDCHIELRGPGTGFFFGADDLTPTNGRHLILGGSVKCTAGGTIGVQVGDSIQGTHRGLTAIGVVCEDYFETGFKIEQAANTTLIACRASSQLPGATGANLASGFASNVMILGGDYATNPGGSVVSVVPEDTLHANLALIPQSKAGTDGLIENLVRASIGLWASDTDLRFPFTGTGPVLTSPDGSHFRLTVDNAGTLTTTPV